MAKRARVRSFSAKNMANFQIKQFQIAQTDRIAPLAYRPVG